MRRHEGAAVAMQMDTEAQMRGSLQTSKTVLQEAMDIGTNILESMAKNREVFKVRPEAARWNVACASLMPCHPLCTVLLVWCLPTSLLLEV